jgi:putative PIN family toxin of toxin-antitoxin system
MPVVVFDTNVLVSSIGWSGTPRRCLELARNGSITLVTCEPMLEELTRTLRDKLRFSPRQLLEAHADLLNTARIIVIPLMIHGVCPDPKDDMVLECAAAAGADYLVTGDKKHLLPLKHFQGIPIVSPAELLRLTVSA